MATRPWTGTETRLLKKHHGDGMSCNGIATKMGRSPSTISVQAARLGLTFAREQTAAANEARRVDAAALRLQLELDLLADAQKLRGRLFEPHLYFEWGGKDHDYAEKQVDQLYPADQLKIMQAVGAAVDRSLKIAQHETGNGIENVKSMFASMGEALGIKPYVPGQDD